MLEFLVLLVLALAKPIPSSELNHYEISSIEISLESHKYKFLVTPWVKINKKSN